MKKNPELKNEIEKLLDRTDMKGNPLFSNFLTRLNEYAEKNGSDLSEQFKQIQDKISKPSFKEKFNLISEMGKESLNEFLEFTNLKGSWPVVAFGFIGLGLSNILNNPDNSPLMEATQIAASISPIFAGIALSAVALTGIASHLINNPMFFDEFNDYLDDIKNLTNGDTIALQNFFKRIGNDDFHITGDEIEKIEAELKNLQLNIKGKDFLKPSTT